jgi:hypothetical protein
VLGDHSTTEQQFRITVDVHTRILKMLESFTSHVDVLSAQTSRIFPIREMSEAHILILRIKEYSTTATMIMTRAVLLKSSW